MMRAARDDGLTKLDGFTKAGRFTKWDGFTLIELVVFIVIIGVAAVGLLTSMRSLLPRTVTPATLTKAAEIAQARMELILAQRDVDGFSNFTDPCAGGTPVAAVCTPTGFTVTVGGVSSSVQWDTVLPGSAYTTAAIRRVTVTVSDGTRNLASVTSLLANY